MRPVLLFGVISFACALFSCASVTVGDTRLSGRLKQVSVADLHSVIEADRQHSKRRIYEVEVVSTDEVHIYHDTRTGTINYDIVRRVHGRWTYIKETGFLT